MRKLSCSAVFICLFACLFMVPAAFADDDGQQFVGKWQTEGKTGNKNRPTKTVFLGIYHVTDNKYRYLAPYREDGKRQPGDWEEYLYLEDGQLKSKGGMVKITFDQQSGILKTHFAGGQEWTKAQD